jgi:hypothetical protein
MSQKEVHREGTQNAFPLNLTEIPGMGNKWIEGFVNVQTELFEKLQESNKQWLDRLQSEANMASDLASTLASARSMPDVMTACQEWSNRRFVMMAEDGKHLFADAQKFMETGARLVWWSNDKRGGSWRG